MDWENASLKELANRLSDNRIMVRRRAIDLLAKFGVPAIQVLEQQLNDSSSTDTRVACVWALTRIGDSKARVSVKSALSDPDETVRQAALHSAALWRDVSALSKLNTMVINGTPHNRRAAAEALGRIGDAEAVNSLLAAAGNFVDRILEHSIIYALIEINDPKSVRTALNSPNPQVLKTALIALDQMPAGDLNAGEIIPYLMSSNPTLFETANWITLRHSDWGPQLAAFLESQFNSKLDKLPVAWISPFETLITQGHPQRRDAVRALDSLPLDSDDADWLRIELLQIARNSRDDTELRTLAMQAISGLKLKIQSPDFEFLESSLKSAQPVQIRTSAANILGRASLTKKQLIKVTEILGFAPPLELKPLLQAFENESDEALGIRLISSLHTAKYNTSLNKEFLQPILAAFPESVQDKAAEFFDSIFKDQKEQADHVEQVLASLPEGDVRRGQTVFNSPATSCNVCHAIGYLGGELGPDLTTIGTIRTKQDLLEAILYPSASLVRSYEPYQVTTTNGTIYTGILREETSNEIELMMGINLPIWISRNEIQDMTPSSLSLMPSGLTAALSEQELADLITFLKETTWR